MSVNIKKLIGTGSSALLLNVLSMGIKFGTNLVLAWLLIPEMFGIAAIITSIVTGMVLLSDVGINDSIIRNEKGEDRLFCGTAWLTQASRGFILYLIVLAIAPLLASFYQLPELKTYLAIAGLALPIQGFKSVYLIVLQRRMNPLPEIKLELVAQLTAAACMLVLAINFQSIWVLISALIISAIVEMVGSHWITPRSFYLFKASKQYFLEILHFGKWIYIGTVAAFLIINIDKLLLGKLESFSTLGIYQVAAAFSMISYSLSVSLLDRLIYPALASSARENQDSMALAVKKLKRVIFPAITAMQLIIFMIAPYFFAQLYPDTFQDAAWMAQLMAVLVWIMLAADFQGTVLVAINKPKIFGLVLLLVAILRPVFGLIAYPYFGIGGFLIGMMFGSLLGFFIYRHYLNQMLRHSEPYELVVAVVALSMIAILFSLSQSSETTAVLPVGLSLLFAAIITAAFVWSLRQAMAPATE